jgi:hypothetical protein
MQFIQSPNYWAGRAGYRPAWLILHGTAGGSSAASIAAYFANEASQVSAHYIVGQDGAIIGCVAEQDTAWANGVITGMPANLPFRTAGDGVHRDAWWGGATNPNYLTISIEHVKPHTDNSDTLTQAQMASSFQLIKEICEKWGIPMRFADSHGGITGHFSMDPVNRSACPGPYPWDALWSYLNRGGIMVPFGWSDDGTTLTAPNGIKVVKGFRDFVLNTRWDPLNYPLEAERGVDPLEISNPQLGSGTRQTFRWSRLEWTAERGAFVGWLGQEALALEVKLAQLQPAQITAAAANAAVADLESIAKSAQDALVQLGAASSS